MDCMVSMRGARVLPMPQQRCGSRLLHSRRPVHTHVNRLQAQAMKENPQNTENPQVMPNPDFSPEDAVTVQLQALQHNCEPWYNHGLLTMYEFAEDVGGLERSRYFGYSKDLYHFDHFMGEYANKLAPTIDNVGFEITQSVQQAPNFHEVYVTVSSAQGDQMKLMFIMKIKDIGSKKGCWMTACIKVVE